MPAAPAILQQCLSQSVLELAMRGLPQMFLPERRLFCSVLRRQPDGTLLPFGTSRRYTLMTLLGLHRFETAFKVRVVNPGPVLDELLRDLGWITAAGDLGNLLWTLAELDPERLPLLYRRVDLSDAIPRFPDYRRGSTTELAWLLTGLALARQVPDARQWKFETVALETFHRLCANQGPHGLFGHLAPGRSLAGWLRGSIGSFADQVYPIIALSHFGAVFNSPRSISRALQCAEAIVRLQGPQGEWWWHYDSAGGTVTRPYPVYSVHQHGMAPMALQAIAGVTHTRDFEPAMERGLEWIAGNNILRQEMRSYGDKLIWRSIALGSRRTELQELAYLLTGRSLRHTVNKPRVVFECRPYELGWALYALAGRQPFGRND
jgi:hypothetical protein